MELSKYIILLGISLLTASTIGDIIVQPGYEKPSKRLEDSRQSPRVGSPRVNSLNSIIVQPGYEHNAKVENTSGKIACPTGCDQQSPKIANPQNEPSNKATVQPGYAQHSGNGNSQENPPNRITAQARYGQAARQGNPTNNIIVQPGYQQQTPRFEIPQPNPSGKIVLQPAYHPQSRMAEIAQSNQLNNVVVQPANQPQSQTAEIPLSNPSSKISIQPGYHPQSRMFDIAQSNPLNNIVFQPGYQFQSMLVGIPRSNLPNNIVVQPGYQAQSSSVEIPSSKIVVQPGYHSQSRMVEIGQSNSLNNIVVQPSYESQSSTADISQINPTSYHPQSRTVEIPQSDPLSNSVIQPGDQAQNLPFEIVQPNQASVLQPGYHPQSRTLEIPQFNPINNFAVQPGYQAQYPTFEIPQPNPTGNIVAYHPQSRTHVIPQINPTDNIVLQPVYDQAPMSEIPFLPAPRTILLHPNHRIQPNRLKIVAPEVTAPKDKIVVQPGYGRVKCYMEFVPHGTYVNNLPKQSSLNYEIQRNQDLQRTLANQLYSLDNQGQQAVPFIDRSKHVPFYAGTSHHVITPLGLRGYKKKKYGWGKVPLFLRTATNAPNCADRIQYVRSLDSGTGSDTGHEKHDVAAKSSIEQSEKNGVVDLRVPEAVTNVDDVKVKRVGPRQSIIPNVHPLDSLLERVSSQRYENPELSNPFVSAGIGSSLKSAAKVVEEKISDFVSPIVDSAKFWDPRDKGIHDGAIERLGDSLQNTEASGIFAAYPNGGGSYNSGRNEPRSNDQELQGIFGASDGNSYNSNSADRSTDMRGIVDQYARRPFSPANIPPLTFDRMLTVPSAYLKSFYDDKITRVR